MTRAHLLPILGAALGVTGAGLGYSRGAVVEPSLWLAACLGVAAANLIQLRRSAVA